MLTYNLVLFCFVLFFLDRYPYWASAHELIDGVALDPFARKQPIYSNKKRSGRSSINSCMKTVQFEVVKMMQLQPEPEP